MKKYILIAGPNGSGKSTLYQTIDSLKDIQRINPDEIIRSFGDWRNPSDVVKAGEIAVKRLKELFEAGESFNQETTLCGKSIIRNIEKARKLGYQVELHYVCVDDVEILKKRIAHRVAQGGHGIPEWDIERRYSESMEALKKVIGMCDVVLLYDNTSGFNRFAVFRNNELCYLSDERPQWYDKLFSIAILI